MSLSIPLDLLSAFTAGILAALSPCALPVLPGVIAYGISPSSDRERRLRTLVVLISLTVTLFALGALVATLATFFTYICFLRLALGIMLVVIGLGLAIMRALNRHPTFLLSCSCKIPRGSTLGGVLLSAALVAAAFPCIAPALLLLLAAPSSRILLRALVFVVGFEFPIVLALVLGQQTWLTIQRRISGISRWYEFLIGTLLILAGVLLLFE